MVKSSYLFAEVEEILLKVCVQYKLKKQNLLRVLKSRLPYRSSNFKTSSIEKMKAFLEVLVKVVSVHRKYIVYERTVTYI